MRLVTAALFVSIGLALLGGCAGPRLVSHDVPDATPLAARYEARSPETSFLRCGAEAESVCAPVSSRELMEEGEKLNKIVVFLGATVEEEGEGFSIGLEYERLISRRWGVGVFFEYTAGDLREWVTGPGITYHPVERAFLFAGAGVAVSREEADRLLLRFGGGYDFPIGRGFFIAPCAYLDWLHGGTAVAIAGFNFGKNF